MLGHVSLAYVFEAGSLFGKLGQLPFVVVSSKLQLRS